MSKREAALRQKAHLRCMIDLTLCQRRGRLTYSDVDLAATVLKQLLPNGGASVALTSCPRGCYNGCLSHRPVAKNHGGLLWGFLTAGGEVKLSDNGERAAVYVRIANVWIVFTLAPGYHVGEDFIDMAECVAHLGKGLFVHH